MPDYRNRIFKLNDLIDLIVGRKNKYKTISNLPQSKYGVEFQRKELEHW